MSMARVECCQIFKGDYNEQFILFTVSCVGLSMVSYARVSLMSMFHASTVIMARVSIMTLAKVEYGKLG